MHQLYGITPYTASLAERDRSSRGDVKASCMPCEISSDPARLDVAVIHRFLSESYWAKDIPLETVKRAIAGSLCFGAYLDGAQIGFARLITDRTTFAYLADVFVLPGHRGKGVSKQMMEFMVAHPETQNLRRWCLVTRDAQGLYGKYGFTPLASPPRWMERYDGEVYQR
jgi:GNAT superfamily N-acetyltransferase